MGNNTVSIYGVDYVDRKNSNAQLIQNVRPIVGQTVLNETDAHIDDRQYTLSNRNGAGAYIIPTEKSVLYLNFIAQKTKIQDRTYQNMISPEFEYFVEEIVYPDEPFTLADGEFYRCATDQPRAKEDHVYYLMVDGAGKVIPNYKTLEVMLAERGKNLQSVRILEKSQCNDIPVSNINSSDASAQWKPEFEDVTNLDALKKMENSAKDAGAIADGAKKELATQIDVVKKQAEAAKAAAEAEKAKADAARAEADAAIEEAKAAQMEADAKRAEFESQIGGKT